jgi:hypothetical protein
MLDKKQITELNKTFASLNEAERRVLIAEDVLKQIEVGAYRPLKGFYINDFTVTRVNTRTKSIQKLFDDIECQCCALGACLLSTTKYKNKLVVDDVIELRSKSGAWKLLKDVFTSKQLLMIEYAFEGRFGGDRVGEDCFKDELSFPEEKECVEFGRNYVNSRPRLIAIMKNIIENKGEFIPTKND